MFSFLVQFNCYKRMVVVKIPNLLKGEKFVSDAVVLVQDNIFLNQVIKEMTEFILDSGTFNLSKNKRNQKDLILKYFKTLAIEHLNKNNYNMDINTPWGKKVDKLRTAGVFNPLEPEDVSNNSTEDIDVFYDEDEYEDKDEEDE